MELTGEYTFDANQERAWEVLRDPNVLAMIIPMAMNMKRTGENQYKGQLFFRVGNIAGTFQGNIKLLNMQEPNRYDIEVQGISAIGQVSIKGEMHLEPHDAQTTMFYHGNIDFGGRIASVGSRLLENAVQSILQKSFQMLNNYFAIKRLKP